MAREDNIDRVFKKLKHNYRRQLALSWGLRGLIISLTGFIIWLLINRFTELWLDGTYLLYVFAAIPVISYFSGYIWPISLRKIVRSADRKIDFEERLITLYEYNEKESDNPFLKFLRDDVTGVFDLLQAGKIFPRKWMPEAGIVIPLIIFLSIFIFWGGESPLAPGIRHPFPGQPDIEQHTSELFNDEADGEGNEGEAATEEDEELSTDQPEKFTSETDSAGEQSSDIDEDGEQLDREQADSQQRSSLEDRLNQSDESDNMEDQQQQSGDSSEGKAGTTSPSEASGERQISPDPDTENQGEESGEETTAAMDSGQQDETNGEDAGDDNGQPPQSDEDNSQEISNEEQQTDGNNENGEETDETDETDETEEDEQTASSERTPQQEETQTENSSRPQEQYTQQERGTDDTETTDEGRAGSGSEPGMMVQQEEEIDVSEAPADSSYYLNRVKSQLNNNQYLAEYLQEMMQPQPGASAQITQERLIEYREELLNEFSNEEIPVLYRDIIKDYFKSITEPGNEN